MLRACTIEDFAGLSDRGNCPLCDLSLRFGQAPVSLYVTLTLCNLWSAHHFYVWTTTDVVVVRTHISVCGLFKDHILCALSTFDRPSD